MKKIILGTFIVIGLILAITIASGIIVAVEKLELGRIYLETCLNPSAQILVSVKADLEKGEMVAAQEKIDALISSLGTYNHYWYDMPRIDKLAEEFEVNKPIQATPEGAPD